MAKQKPFETSGNYDNTMAGSFVLEPTFWDGINVRETIESIAMAIVLAMTFKTLQAEAYIIPTGSMAPTLMGQHVEVACSDCDYYFQVGATAEGPSGRVPRGANQSIDKYRLHKVRCPLTFEIRELARVGATLPKDANGQPIMPQANDESFAGDRIVVSKLEHLWREPQRWDVIVFKYPGAAKANYIKRLVGLPGESLTINNGDVYTQATDTLDANLPRTQTIARKPPGKLAKIAIPVQDSYYFSSAMRKAGMPPSWIPDGTRQLNSPGPSWHEKCVAETQWKVQADGDEPATYALAAPANPNGQYDWLRFRHMVPRQAHWQAVRSGEPLPTDYIDSPGHLVTDYYCYNDGMMYADTAESHNWDFSRFGGNWVGDLVMEAEVTVGPQGTLALDAVEGGVHFLCEIDVATGQATLSSKVSAEGVTVRFADQTSLDDSKNASLQFETPLKGAGSYQIRYANCDDRIYLWIDDQEVEIPGEGCYVRSGQLTPYYDDQDYGDARPLGVGFQGGELSIERLKVFRDFYYLGRNDFNVATLSSLRDRSGAGVSRSRMLQYYESPIHWGSPEFREWFEGFDQNLPLKWGDEAYRLTEDQFFPMGDNSPQSEDARKWQAPNYVERRFMIGRALMVYWPHTWNSPLYWPNFNRMRIIH